MRYNQKQYFATKSPQALDASKRLEKQIDDEITRVNAILAERAKQQKPNA